MSGYRKAKVVFSRTLRVEAPGHRSALARFFLGPRTVWPEALAVFLVYQGFERLRGVVPDSAVDAAAHASQLIRAERALGIFVEASVQHLFIDNHLAIQAFDAYYGLVHFIVPAVALVLLWRRDRARYIRFRNAFAFMLALALPGFAFWPLTPPRLLPPSYGFVDTAAGIGGLGPLDRGNHKDDNEVAAMPSLHVGWSSWCVLALFPVLRRRRTKALLVLYPFVTLLAVVVTANHYLLDGAGGLAVMAGGIGLEELRRRWRRRRDSDPPDVEAEHVGVATVDGGQDP